MLRSNAFALGPKGDGGGVKLLTPDSVLYPGASISLAGDDGALAGDGGTVSERSGPDNTFGLVILPRPETNWDVLSIVNGLLHLPKVGGEYANEIPELVVRLSTQIQVLETLDADAVDALGKETPGGFANQFFKNRVEERFLRGLRIYVTILNRIAILLLSRATETAELLAERMGSSSAAFREMRVARSTRGDPVEDAYLVLDLSNALVYVGSQRIPVFPSGLAASVGLQLRTIKLLDMIGQEFLYATSSFVGLRPRAPFPLIYREEIDDQSGRAKTQQEILVDDLSQTFSEPVATEQEPLPASFDVSDLSSRVANSTLLDEADDLVETAIARKALAVEAEREQARQAAEAEAREAARADGAAEAMMVLLAGEQETIFIPEGGWDGSVSLDFSTTIMSEAKSGNVSFLDNSGQRGGPLDMFSQVEETYGVADSKAGPSSASSSDSQQPGQDRTPGSMSVRDFMFQYPLAPPAQPVVYNSDFGLLALYSIIDDIETPWWMDNAKKDGKAIRRDAATVILDNSRTTSAVKVFSENFILNASGRAEGTSSSPDGAAGLGDEIGSLGSEYILGRMRTVGLEESEKHGDNPAFTLPESKEDSIYTTVEGLSLAPQLRFYAREDEDDMEGVLTEQNVYRASGGGKDGTLEFESGKTYFVDFSSVMNNKSLDFDAPGVSPPAVLTTSFQDMLNRPETWKFSDSVPKSAAFYLFLRLSLYGMGVEFPADTMDKLFSEIDIVFKNQITRLQYLSRDQDTDDMTPGEMEIQDVISIEEETFWGGPGSYVDVLARAMENDLISRRDPSLQSWELLLADFLTSEKKNDNAKRLVGRINVVLRLVYFQMLVDRREDKEKKNRQLWFSLGLPGDDLSISPESADREDARFKETLKRGDPNVMLSLTKRTDEILKTLIARTVWDEDSSLTASFASLSWMITLSTFADLAVFDELLERYQDPFVNELGRQVEIPQGIQVLVELAAGLKLRFEPGSQTLAAQIPPSAFVVSDFVADTQRRSLVVDAVKSFVQNAEFAFNFLATPGTVLKTGGILVGPGTQNLLAQRLAADAAVRIADSESGITLLPLEFTRDGSTLTPETPVTARLVFALARPLAVTAQGQRSLEEGDMRLGVDALLRDLRLSTPGARLSKKSLSGRGISVLFRKEEIEDADLQDGTLGDLERLVDDAWIIPKTWKNALKKGITQAGGEDVLVSEARVGPYRFELFARSRLQIEVADINARLQQYNQPIDNTRTPEAIDNERSEYIAELERNFRLGQFAAFMPRRDPRDLIRALSQSPSR